MADLKEVIAQMNTDDLGCLIEALSQKIRQDRSRLVVMEKELMSRMQQASVQKPGGGS